MAILFRYTPGVPMRSRPSIATFTICCGILAAVVKGTEKPSGVPPAEQKAFNSITPANLKGDLSFLASDALEGRYTPSPGLDVAAEFIASQFRAAGLEPAGNQDYFQIAKMVDRHMRPAESDLILRNGSQTHSIASNTFLETGGSEAATISNAPVISFSSKDPALLKGKDLTGKVVLAPQIAFGSIPKDQLMGVMLQSRAFDQQVAASKALLEITAGPRRGGQQAKLMTEEDAAVHRIPASAVSDDELSRWIQQPANPAEERTVSVALQAPEDEKLTLKNIVGLLRGSDPKLKNTYVLLTAHYDHIGTRATGDRLSPSSPKTTNDQIYNGANDDGSGTVSVIEIARALTQLPAKPKRSIVFMTFFGEERGDIGSGYYGTHPLFPIANTIADLNLEQVGRTDSTVGQEVNNASVTGFDYSDVTRYLQDAGGRTGIKIYLDKEASDEYFTRSDNAALAEQGVPAHTLCVAFDYPDYHGLGDEWQKIDYDNMARVDRAVALALVDLANSPQPPQWNAQNPKTRPFRDARARTEQEVKAGVKSGTY